jgi:hypothetical protein
MTNRTPRVLQRTQEAADAFLDTNLPRLEQRLRNWLDENPDVVPVLHYQPEATPPTLRLRPVADLELAVLDECEGLEQKLRQQLPPGSWWFLYQISGAHCLVPFVKQAEAHEAPQVLRAAGP